LEPLSASSNPMGGRAVIQARYGGPEVLRLARRPRSRPGEGQVLVRVHAASVNARDWRVMRGEPRLARLMDRTLFAARRPRIATRGTDSLEWWRRWATMSPRGSQAMPCSGKASELSPTTRWRPPSNSQPCLRARRSMKQPHCRLPLPLPCCASTRLRWGVMCVSGRSPNVAPPGQTCLRRFPRVGSLDQDALVPQPPERGVTIVVGAGRGVPEAVRPRVSRLVAALRNLRTWPNPRFSRCCTTSCTPPPCPQRVQRKAGSDHWRETSLSPLYAGHRRLSHVVPSIERRLR
jgi:hypothetical protein